MAQTDADSADVDATDACGIGTHKIDADRTNGRGWHQHGQSWHWVEIDRMPDSKEGS